MPTATNRQPVAVFYPPTEQYVIVKRGDEFDKNHPFAKDKANAWLFEEDQGEGSRLYAGEPSEPVEQATSAPGEKRSYRRKPDQGKDDEKTTVSNGPIRSGDR